MENKSQYNFVVTQEEEGLRLDRYLTQNVTVRSRSYLQKLVKQGSILVNGVVRKSGSEVKSGDRIRVSLPEAVPLEAVPEPIPLDIIYEDDSLLVINKPAGIVVHPGAGHLRHTLVNALLYYCGGSLSGIGGVLRPGIVHRLDRDTSGCMVVAKNDMVHNGLTRQFQDRKVNKQYFAIVAGWVEELSGDLQNMIGRHPTHRKKMTVRFDRGKQAVTSYKVTERFPAASCLDLQLKTGRTHQIRVQMAHLGHPVLGDQEYGGKKSWIKGVAIPRQMLHAYRLGFNHPAGNNWMEFTSDIPRDMKDLLEYLRRRE